LTRIYTRGGDAGLTSLGDGSRVSKLHPLVRAYGAVDELNSIVGWARLAADRDGLERIQNELFDLGADLSVPFAPDDGKLRLTQAAIDRLEQDCDEANEALPELRASSGRDRGCGAPARRPRRRRAEREVPACARAEVNRSPPSTRTG
jgi:cob(I)alamin adenosyltransferase